MTPYHQLEQRFARLAAIEDTIGILQWDTETVMPEGAADLRAESLAALKGIAHDLLAQPAVAELIVAAEHEAGMLDDWQRANLREMRRLNLHASAVPRDLVEANERAVVRAAIIWREARARSDFAMLAGPLEEVLTLQRRVAEAKGAALGVAPYDALLDDYDSGLRQAMIDPVFAALAAALPDLVARAAARRERMAAVAMPTGPFPVEAQRRLGEVLMRAVGFDFSRGRLDVSQHPFCGGATGDVRITSRYNENDFLSSLMAILHESGHALYEQGRPQTWLRQPVGRARGMIIHESQSLLVEVQAGRSLEFITYLAPLARDAFAGAGPAWDVGAIHGHLTRVEPSLIRVDADPVTYASHIIIRYELERAMIAGDLAIADLPAAYDAAIKQRLGLTVPDDRRGCLQDIHWATGLWGYFPTYLLGAMAAAQLFDAACRAEPDARAALARGDFAPLRDWLRVNIHTRGSLLATDELMRAATGRPIDAAFYGAHLAARYAAAA